jgi:hypothetical protein
MVAGTPGSSFDSRPSRDLSSSEEKLDAEIDLTLNMSSVKNSLQSLPSISITEIGMEQVCNMLAIVEREGG